MNKFLLFLTSLSAAAASAQPYFRNPVSAFASGDAPLESLQKSIETVEPQQWWYVESAHQMGWVHSSDFITLPDLWNHKSSLGAALARVNTSLYAKPNFSSHKLKRVPELTRLQLYNFAIGTELDLPWVRASAGKQFGFINLNELLTAFDLTSLVQTRSGKTFTVLYRDNSDLVTFWQKKLPLVLVSEPLDTHHVVARSKHLQLRRQPLDSSRVVGELSQFENVRIDDTRNIHWAKSRLSDVGDIWWPQDSPAIPPKTYSTQEIFNRGLYDLAGETQNPLIQVASAKGIFLTLNGKEWHRITKFGSSNYPLTFTSSGTLFIGPYLSRDAGQSFTNYLKWDEVTAFLHHTLHHSPQCLRLASLNFNQNLEMKLEIGWHKYIKLISPDDGQSWQMESQVLPDLAARVPPEVASTGPLVGVPTSELR